MRAVGPLSDVPHCSKFWRLQGGAGGIFWGWVGWCLWQGVCLLSNRSNTNTVLQVHNDNRGKEKERAEGQHTVSCHLADRLPIQPTWLSGKICFQSMNMLHHNIITACTSERATTVAAHRLQVVLMMVTSQSLVLFRLVSVDVAIEETLRNALII